MASSPWKFGAVPPNGSPTPTLPNGVSPTPSAMPPMHPSMIPGAGNFGLAELSSMMAANPALASLYFGNIQRNMFSGPNMFLPQMQGPPSSSGLMGNSTPGSTPSPQTMSSPPFCGESKYSQSGNTNQTSPKLSNTSDDALNLSCTETSQPNTTASPPPQSTSPNSTEHNSANLTQQAAAAAAAAAAFYASQFPRFYANFKLPPTPMTPSVKGADLPPNSTPNGSQQSHSPTSKPLSTSQPSSPCEPTKLFGDDNECSRPNSPSPSSSSSMINSPMSDVSSSNRSNTNNATTPPV